MINKLWTDVSLENYNNWYPLTGKIIETPPQYINTWPIVNDWFTTFAIRAQNDINAYLDFILSKFPFNSFKDELIKETLRDMVYVMVEHWVFNRTPIEFNVDATIQFNNGTSFSASSIPTINVWDLAPSRMKIWARLTELKQVFSNYNQDEIDIEKIDLRAFYTRNQVDELIKEQKAFILSKQMKLYDDLVDDNETEVYRGPVTNFINKGYVATEYDKETETMILDWPDEIGTLPPEALQNNPQIGDFTHAATADFSAKQQKRITTNENEITKLNSELTKTNENIDDIKNNWFNIETSPLWKKMSSFIPSNEFGKIYLAIWGYIYQPPSTPTDNYIYSDKKTIFNLSGEIQRTTQKTIKLDELNVNDNVKIQLLFTKELNDITVTSNDVNYQPASITLYQYIGKGTPTEFIAEESTERDYYTKQETNNLLDKKQDKLIAGENIKIDEKTNTISATGGGIDPTKYYTKPEVDKKLEDKIDKDQFQYAFAINALGTENPNLETTDKTIVGAINEINAKSGSAGVWKEIGSSIDNRTWGNFKPKLRGIYRVSIIWEANGALQDGYKQVIFFKSATAIGTGTRRITSGKIGTSDATLDIRAVYNPTTGNDWTLLLNGGDNGGAIFSLEELQATNFNITSKTLIINKIKDDEYDIELKENPTPTPCPCPKWKDVAFVEKNGEINYELKNNTYYKIFYDNSIMTNSLTGKYPCLIKEFYWIMTPETNYSDLWVPISCLGMGAKFENSLLIINKKRIYWQNKKHCDIWKLQELQE